MADRDEALLVERFYYYNRLDVESQRELRGHIQVLMHEKNFEGCGGLELTGDMKLLISAQAAVLLLHRKHHYYPNLYSILVYPTEFRPGRKSYLEPGLVTHDDRVLLGEWSELGAVALAWDVIEFDLEHPLDGNNVVYHELAHELDDDTPAAAGVPWLPDWESRDAWAEVFSREYDRLTKAVDRGQRTFIDPYGAEHPTEFFAVLTEHFFEEPHGLKSHHPELYDLLSNYYCQDPASFLPAK